MSSPTLINTKLVFRTYAVVTRAPDVRVVALTASTDEARMMGVLRALARGVVTSEDLASE